MRGTSEAGSGPYCLFREQSVVKKKETAAGYNFSNKITIPSARSRNTGLNPDELVARDLFQEFVCVSPSGVAFSI